MIEAQQDRAVKVGDSGAVSIAKANLGSYQIKKYQAPVVRVRFKRMSYEATNMGQEFRGEELKHAVDRHIVSITSPDGQCRTTNEAICREFRDFFEKLFTRGPELSSGQFDTYLADFHRREALKTALKTVGTGKSPGIDGLP